MLYKCIKFERFLRYNLLHGKDEITALDEIKWYEKTGFSL